MNIIIDSRWYNKKPSGVGNYVAHILRGLSGKNDIRVQAFGSIPTDLKKAANIKHIVCEGAKKKALQGLWKTIHFPPIEWLSSNSNLIHFTNGTAAPHRKTPYILTIHDLSYIDFPETIEKKNLLFLQRNVYISAQKACHIIAVSEYTKTKIVNEFNIDPDKITVIYNGFGSYKDDNKQKESKQTNQNNSILRKYNLKKDFFVSISTIEPRKDFITQIRAYQKLPQEIQAEFDLVIAGGKGWKHDNVFTEANKYSGPGNIHFLGYIDDKDINKLIKSAKIYIHSSIDEGFGISPLHAIGSGCPVIASKTSCHPEILSDHAFYYEVQNTDDLAQTIEETLSNYPSKSELDKKAEYAQKRFSWAKMQTQSIAVYKKVFEEFA